MKYRFGLMCLSFKDSNKGCEALTFTFLKMLQEMYDKNDFEVVCITASKDLGIIPSFFPEMRMSTIILNIHSIRSWVNAFKEIKKLDAVFDGSYGDGFTGIYGTARNGIQCLRKQIVYWAGKPLFLLPQTYGKYKHPFQMWSKRIIRNATLAYARDDTAQLVPDCGVKTTSDMAFMLPYDKTQFKFEGGKKRFGINVSSLLWDDETGKRFNLTVDYRDFYKKLINYLLVHTDFEIHLIPHVIDSDNYSKPENDCRSIDELARMFESKLYIAPAFASVLEAKSYIANMDMFLGSRMHSTIGAISSGVTTIPFSYAHKFESLYQKIGYEYIVSATKLSTDEAIFQIIEWIENPEPLAKSGKAAVAKAKANVMAFENDLKQSLHNQNLL